jgi:hypothetical protein
MNKYNKILLAAIGVLVAVVVYLVLTTDRYYNFTFSTGTKKPEYRTPLIYK